MAAEITTIQSLKAVDAWIDVINANINGGVRTAYKSSRLKFAGSNSEVSRAGTTTSLPLQFPESSLTTANTVIDFTQGAVTSSTEVSHLAIQGPGFFLLADPATIDPLTGLTVANPNARFYLTRDGEFHTNAQGLLVHSSGYYLVKRQMNSTGRLFYDTTADFGAAISIRAVYNNVELPLAGAVPQSAVRLTEYLINAANLDVSGAVIPGGNGTLVQVTSGLQSLEYAHLGSTVYDFGYFLGTGINTNTNIRFTTNDPDYTVLTKSLEASNASMTQSVPELSLAQKLFSALTKVFQTKQTNVDGVINLIR